ncbi:uncharacterized protein LOC100185475 [Ciona intestinalis]
MEQLFLYLLLVLLVSTERCRGSLRWRYDYDRCYQRCKCYGTEMKCNVTLYSDLYEPGPTVCYEALSFRFYRINIHCPIKFTITAVPDLRSLDLSGNRMSHLPNTVLQNLPSLQHLNISRNRLNFFQWGMLPNSTHLKSLDLSNNRLNSLALLQAQHAFPNLERLYLSNNRLITIIRMSLTLPKLRELNLRNTILHSIHSGVFDSFSNLQTLDLGQNYLKTIPARLFALLRNLRVLRLDYNLLQQPDPSWFTPMIQNNFATTVDLQNNPWICDSRIYNFWNLVKELSTDGKNRTLAQDLNLICENPINEKGKTLNCLSFDDFESTTVAINRDSYETTPRLTEVTPFRLSKPVSPVVSHPQETSTHQLTLPQSSSATIQPVEVSTCAPNSVNLTQQPRVSTSSLSQSPILDVDRVPTPIAFEKPTDPVSSHQTSNSILINILAIAGIACSIIVAAWVFFRFYNKKRKNALIPNTAANDSASAYFTESTFSGMSLDNSSYGYTGAVYESAAQSLCVQPSSESANQQHEQIYCGDLSPESEHSYELIVEFTPGYATCRDVG